MISKKASEKIPGRIKGKLFSQRHIEKSGSKN